MKVEICIDLQLITVHFDHGNSKQELMEVVELVSLLLNLDKFFLFNSSTIF